MVLKSGDALGAKTKKGQRTVSPTTKKAQRATALMRRTLAREMADLMQTTMSTAGAIDKSRRGREEGTKGSFIAGYDDVNLKAAAADAAQQLKFNPVVIPAGVRDRVCGELLKKKRKVINTMAQSKRIKEFLIAASMCTTERVFHMVKTQQIVRPQLNLI